MHKVADKVFNLVGRIAKLLQLSDVGYRAGSLRRYQALKNRANDGLLTSGQPRDDLVSVSCEGSFDTAHAPIALERKELAAAVPIVPELRGRELQEWQRTRRRSQTIEHLRDERRRLVAIAEHLDGLAECFSQSLAVGRL